jgi:hypothetical protein
VPLKDTGDMERQGQIKPRFYQVFGAAEGTGTVKERHPVAVLLIHV